MTPAVENTLHPDYEVRRAKREIARHREALQAGRGDPAFHRRKMSEWFDYLCEREDPRPSHQIISDACRSQ